MKILFILNDAPYGSERSYNALRLASSISKAPQNEVRVFLLGDAVACGKAKQKVPEGSYNVQLMLDSVVRNRGAAAACGTCMDARGITEAELLDGVQRGTLEGLAQWTQWAEKVLVF